MYKTGLGTQDHVSIGQAATLPTSDENTIISVSPIVLSSKKRAVDLQVKVSAPTSGTNLPVILLSHGQGPSNNLSSLHGYGPLVNYWAAHGFVVIQPTHEGSKSLGLDMKKPEDIFYWRSRVTDMKQILDQLDEVLDRVPGLKGRVDSKKIAVVGHSMGGHTAGILLGAQLKDPFDGSTVDLLDQRIKAGILLTPPGNGGAALSPYAFENLPFFREPNFSTMKTPALVVVGDNDPSAHLTVSGWKWHADPYTYSSGQKNLLNLFGAGHGLGGISGYDVAETTDESPERVAIVQRMTWAYLRSALYENDSSWKDACEAFAKLGLGEVESKTDKRS
jgi:predicted dienelactone hydrolase